MMSFLGMDISVDIRGKSVDMDGKFHIHIKPAFLVIVRPQN